MREAVSNNFTDIVDLILHSRKTHGSAHHRCGEYDNTHLTRDKLNINYSSGIENGSLLELAILHNNFRMVRILTVYGPDIEGTNSIALASNLADKEILNYLSKLLYK